MSGWDEAELRVTQSFEEWFSIDSDQRVFLRKGLEFSKNAYDRAWKHAKGQPGDPDSDLADALDKATDGLWPEDFEWMHLSGVIKDAVTNFEVYLEHAADEVLTFHGHRFPDRKKSAHWERLREFYSLLGVELASPAVVEARELRHILTHRRGELRTKQQRERFGSDEPFMESVAHLTADDVERRMDELAEVVRNVDAAAFDHTWGRVRSEAVLAYTSDPLATSRRSARRGSADSHPSSD